MLKCDNCKFWNVVGKCDHDEIGPAVNDERKKPSNPALAKQGNRACYFHEEA